MADKDPGYSRFVQAVAGDGSSPPDVRVLTGWFGPSGEEGHVRLYLDATLGAYVDIPGDAVLYSEEIPNSHPSGQRSVWVSNDAELKEGGTAIARAAKFLFGQVQQDFLGVAGGAQQQVPQTQVCLTFRPGCQPTSPPCITAAPCTCPGPVTVRWPDCGSAVDACPTRICDFPQVQQAAAGGGPAPTAGFCVPRTQTINCRPRTMAPCPTMLGCGLQAARMTQVCPTWPPELCGFPQVDANAAAFAAGGKTVVLPGPGTSQFCVTNDCQTPIIACPDPNPSVAKPCSTAVPALCPDPRQVFAAGGQQSTDVCPTSLGCGGGAGAIGHTAPGWCGGYSGGPCVTQSPCTCHAQPGGFDAAAAATGPGWTCMCPPQQTRYPQCLHSSVGPVCVTRPPCF